MNTVIFDMDGVIFDTERLCMESWQKVASDHGMDMIEKTFHKCIGTNERRTREIVLEDMGQDFSYEEFRKQASVIMHQDIEQNGMRMMPGVKKLLSFLKENHYRIGLASSTRKEVVEQELQSVGLLSYFEVLICGDMVTKSKPDPDIYLMACKAIGVAPEDAYAIEDSYNGIRAAAAAGMKPIMVPDMIPADEEMKRLSTYIFENLYEVLDFLQESLAITCNTCYSK